jgi:hypothetical protein
MPLVGEKKTQERGWIVLAFSFSILKCFRCSKKRVVCRGLKQTQEFLYWFLHNLGVVQFPFLSREFTIITRDYNCLTTTARDFQCSSSMTTDFI